MSDRNVNKSIQLHKNLIKKSKGKNRLYQTMIAASCSVLMFTGVSTPAHAASLDYGTDGVTAAPSENDMTFDEYMDLYDAPVEGVQTLKTPTSSEPQVIETEVRVEVSTEWLAEQERIKAEEAAAAQAAAEAEAARQAAPVVQNTTPRAAAVVSYSSVPQGSGASGLVAAARAQVGGFMDCTDLVQNALAGIGAFPSRAQGGYDLGPMDFGRFGAQISPSEARAGDILMRSGHVAVYTGDGVNHSAVHGGWNGGSVVETHYDANPHSYVVIRLP